MGGSSDGKRKLGRILLRQRLVTNDELDELLTEQQEHPGQRLGSAAVRHGKISEVDLLKALSEQHGLPGIDLTQVVVPLDNLKLIPEEIARQHLILPILVKEDRIFLAMADPADKRVVDEIEFVTGRRVYPYVALQDSLSQVIEDAYRLGSAGEAYYVGPHVPEDYLNSLGLGPRPEAHPSEPPEPRPGTAHAVVLEEQPSVELQLSLDDDEIGFGDLLDDDDLDGEDSLVGPAGTRSVPPPPPADLDLRGPPPPPPSLLPGPPDASTAEAPSKEPAGSQRKHVVLVVDDEDDIRRLLGRVLADRGYEVVEAGRGLEALSKVRERVPDVILLDAMLPEIHGFEISRRIKGSKRYGHIPIIMVSAVYRGWRIAEDLKSSYGVHAFIEKPFKVAEVLEQVALALRGTPESAGGSSHDGETTQEAQGFLDQGMAAYQDGDLDRAIGLLKEGVGIDPLSFRLHYHLGLLHGRGDNVYEAIHELETAVSLHPRHFSALKNLAVLYQKAGFKHKAIELWERALGAAPDDQTRLGIKDHLVGML